MIKAEFVRTLKYTAVQFDPNEHPWHHSVQRQTVDGKIPDYEKYFCIIPCDKIYTIRPGDWIIVDDMNSAQFVFNERDAEMMGIKRIEEETGTEVAQVGPVTLCHIKGNYRDCLDKAMVMWEEHKKSLPEDSRKSIYGFAYWLIRYSGLVQPVSK
jgi:hypothetical protein